MGGDKKAIQSNNAKTTKEEISKLAEFIVTTLAGVKEVSGDAKAGKLDPELFTREYQSTVEKIEKILNSRTHELNKENKEGNALLKERYSIGIRNLMLIKKLEGDSILVKQKTDENIGQVCNYLSLLSASLNNLAEHSPEIIEMQGRLFNLHLKTCNSMDRTKPTTLFSYIYLLFNRISMLINSGKADENLLKMLDKALSFSWGDFLIFYKQLHFVIEITNLCIHRLSSTTNKAEKKNLLFLITKIANKIVTEHARFKELDIAEELHVTVITFFISIIEAYLEQNKKSPLLLKNTIFLLSFILKTIENHSLSIENHEKIHAKIAHARENLSAFLATPEGEKCKDLFEKIHTLTSPEVVQASQETTLKAKINLLETALQKQASELEGSEENLKKASSETAELEQLHNELTEENSQLTADYRALNSQKESLEQQLKKLRNQIEKLPHQIKEKNRQTQAIEHQRENHQIALIAKQDKEIAALSSKIDQLKNEASAQKSSHASALEEKDGQIAQLHAQLLLQTITTQAAIVKEQKARKTPLSSAAEKFEKAAREYISEAIKKGILSSEQGNAILSKMKFDNAAPKNNISMFKN